MYAQPCMHACTAMSTTAAALRCRTCSSNHVQLEPHLAHALAAAEVSV